MAQLQMGSPSRPQVRTFHHCIAPRDQGGPRGWEHMVEAALRTPGGGPHTQAGWGDTATHVPVEGPPSVLDFTATSSQGHGTEPQAQTQPFRYGMITKNQALQDEQSKRTTPCMSSSSSQEQGPASTQEPGEGRLTCWGSGLCSPERPVDPALGLAGYKNKTKRKRFLQDHTSCAQGIHRPAQEKNKTRHSGCRKLEGREGARLP